MTLPALVLGIVLSTFYGAAFHFWKGGNLLRLFFYCILSWLGFWIGHAIGAAIGWSFAAAGPINTGMATLGSSLFLFFGEWLGRVEISKK
jgi:hypothetical protein